MCYSPYDDLQDAAAYIRGAKLLLRMARQRLLFKHEDFDAEKWLRGLPEENGFQSINGEIRSLQRNTVGMDSVQEAVDTLLARIKEVAVQSRTIFCVGKPPGED